uniref:Uncharacterized protein n=1 Tax=Timema monikensis TaxID=170555 RepID=A0A7R9HKG1_9NEOP|nr:unnamed protein product [Timema monikensis]
MRGKKTFVMLMKKYEIIQEVDEKKITKTEIVQRHGIQKLTLFTILKMREEIVNSMQKEGHYVKAKNLKDAMHANLEQTMLEWFSQHRAQNVRINGPMMQRKANQIALSGRVLLETQSRNIIFQLPVVITERQVPSKQLYISDRASSSTAALQRRSDPSLGIKWVTDDEDAWRVNYLIYQPMDLRTMDCKAQNNKYRTLEEFQADAQTIVHNVVIYHGVNSSLADMARQMLRDCIYDLQEIRQCRDCYRMSNEKEDKHWFCQPCKPKHELVYAKQKGFPYWPAKVIKIEGQMYDVRFFGGHHQRAVLDKTYIRPISVNIHTLQETEASIPKLINESITVRVPSDEDDEDDDEDEEEEEEEQGNCAEKKQSHKITPEDDEPISSSSKSIKDSRKDTNSQEDVVSSSCKEQRSRTLSTQTPARWMKILSKNENSKVKLAKEFELEKQKALDAAMKNLEERLKAENAAQLKDIIEKHNLLISETKRKQWGWAESPRRELACVGGPEMGWTLWGSVFNRQRVMALADRMKIDKRK